MGWCGVMVCYGLLAIGVCIGDKFDTFIGRGERVGGGGKERREEGRRGERGGRREGKRGERGRSGTWRKRKVRWEESKGQRGCAFSTLTGPQFCL